MRRMIGRREFLASAAATGLALPAVRAARAQGGAAETPWPNRPVRFIVPLAPGGAIDFIARAVGDVMSRSIGQQIVVENRTGAGGTLGMDLALKSAPDGYTVLITNDNAASAPHMMSLGYDYTKELLPVCYLGRQPQVLAVHPSLGVNSVAELVNHANANPGLGLATSGVGSNQHVLCEWFKREAGIRLDHVPYRGAGQAVNDLIAAHVKTAFLGPTALVPHYRAGTLRLLAQSSVARAPTLPEVPTLEEAGYAAFLPPATPPAIISQLNAEMVKALQDPKLLDTFNKGAVEAVGGRPEELGRLAQSDSAKYARLVKELGIRTK
jgi:tripartite-type tricarboxylate transporter receptor subunit TctC